mmetsp:Transcript_10288/g.32602  ORF Transcript_10288/g.32602 Transcript_10288/m.32602 type:complete len:344 (-) Transcript_10288:856-1887(-)
MPLRPALLRALRLRAAADGDSGARRASAARRGARRAAAQALHRPAATASQPRGAAARLDRLDALATAPGHRLLLPRAGAAGRAGGPVAAGAAAADAAPSSRPLPRPDALQPLSRRAAVRGRCRLGVRQRRGGGRGAREARRGLLGAQAARRALRAAARGGYPRATLPPPPRQPRAARPRALALGPGRAAAAAPEDAGRHALARVSAAHVAGLHAAHHPADALARRRLRLDRPRRDATHGAVVQGAAAARHLGRLPAGCGPRPHHPVQPLALARPLRADQLPRRARQHGAVLQADPPLRGALPRHALRRPRAPLPEARGEAGARVAGRARGQRGAVGRGARLGG